MCQRASKPAGFLGARKQARGQGAWEMSQEACRVPGSKKASKGPGSLEDRKPALSQRASGARKPGTFWGAREPQSG